MLEVGGGGPHAYRHDASSLTDTLQDARVHGRQRLDEFTTLVRQMSEKARGVVVALGGRPIFAEVLAGPRTFARAFHRLLHGYAFEALEWEEDGTSLGVAAANEFFAAMNGSQRE